MSTHGAKKQYTFEEKKLVMESYFSDRYRGAGVSLKPFSAICGLNFWTLRDWPRVIGWDAQHVELQQQYTDHRVERFALHGFADVNDYLQNRPRTSTRTKLSAEQRLSICLDERSSREVAAQYGVHHSYVCSIRQEAAAVLREH